MADPYAQFQVYLDSARADNAARMDALSAEIEQRRLEQQATLDDSENDWGQVGSALLSGLASYAGSGFDDIGGAAIAGANAGTSYYNNLEAQEAKRYAAIGDEITDLRNSRKSAQDFGEQIVGSGLTFGGQAAIAGAKGEFVGSPEWEMEQQAKLDNAKALNDINNPIIDSAALDQIPGMEGREGIRKDDANIAARGNTVRLGYGNLAMNKTVKAQGLEQLKAAGVSLFQLPQPTEEKKLSDTTSAYEKLVTIKDRISQHVKENGVQWFGTKSAERDDLFAEAFEVSRKLRDSGANFTLMELNLAKAKFPSISEFTDYLEAKARGYGSPEDIVNLLQFSKGVDRDEYASGLLGYGAFLPGYQYKPETARQYGFKLDEQGRAVPTDFIDQRVANLYKEADYYNSKAIPGYAGTTPLANSPVMKDSPTGVPTPGSTPAISPEDRQKIEAIKARLRADRGAVK